jgi:hypothetical protein
MAAESNAASWGGKWFGVADGCVGTCSIDLTRLSRS